MNFKQLKALGWKNTKIVLSPEARAIIEQTHNVDELINNIILDGGINGKHTGR